MPIILASSVRLLIYFKTPTSSNDRETELPVWSRVLGTSPGKFSFSIRYEREALGHLFYLTGHVVAIDSKAGAVRPLPSKFYRTDGSIDIPKDMSMTLILLNEAS